VTFDDFGLNPAILKGVREMGYLRPTPVQEEAIPPVLEGRDVMASAQTGTGKTAAFVLPILHRLMGGTRKRGPRALIVAPTRELAQQSADHIDMLSKHTQLRGTAIYGGVAFPSQIRALTAGVDLVSATPGRLLDHASGGRLKLLDVEILVIDEADRMMDMGFLPDVRRILSLLPVKRQNLVFSATLPPETLRLSETICKNAVRIQIGTGKTSVPAGIRHAVYPVIHEQKLELLMRLMHDMGKDASALVFTRTKDRADRLAESLGRAGIRTAVMHGDRSQSERVAALESFRRGAHQVLVATDIAARGLDIEDISHVINYDIPEEPENYIHRIGRTGRAEAEGDAFTLMAPEEELWITAVERILNHRLPRVILPDFTYHASTVAGSYHPRPFYIATRRPGQRGRGGGGFGRGGGRGGGGSRRH